MSNTDPAQGHVQISHDFTFDNFKYENEVHYQPCVKASIYFKKKDGVSYEHFAKHWAHVHADLTLASKNFGLFKVQRYSQHHQISGMREGLSRMGLKPMEFDGCSTLWFKTWEDFENFFTSPEYESNLAGDCSHFMDTDGGLAVFAGHDVIVFGKGIPDIDDRDGVTEFPRVDTA
ncbi:EthD domain-containing protein [Dactylonectria estremocensis]|uniref:EthD domain-containing protein n=1 Tax=Dactylonectria estremocensis TaxID=1079267 RepID=A0A9P9FCM3_9HYPO|nr:EthD domain-containing protein [Dactylonectria estremocensis]